MVNMLSCFKLRGSKKTYVVNKGGTFKRTSSNDSRSGLPSIAESNDSNEVYHTHNLTNNRTTSSLGTGAANVPQIQQRETSKENKSNASPEKAVRNENNVETVVLRQENQKKVEVTSGAKEVSNTAEKVNGHKIENVAQLEIQTASVSVSAENTEIKRNVELTHKQNEVTNTQTRSKTATVEKTVDPQTENVELVIPTRVETGHFVHKQEEASTQPQREIAEKHEEHKAENITQIESHSASISAESAKNKLTEVINTQVSCENIAAEKADAYKTETAAQAVFSVPVPVENVELKLASEGNEVTNTQTQNKSSAVTQVQTQAVPVLIPEVSAQIEESVQTSHKQAETQAVDTKVRIEKKTENIPQVFSVSVHEETTQVKQTQEINTASVSGTTESEDKNIITDSEQRSNNTHTIVKETSQNNLENNQQVIVRGRKLDGVTFGEVTVVVADESDESENNAAEDDSNGSFPENLTRREGFREPVKLNSGQHIKSHPKSEKETSDIKNAFAANEFLKTVLKEDQLNTLVDAMYLREVEENEIIIQEGEPGNHLYVSAEGTYDVYVNNKKVNSFNDFRVFGELAILYNPKRMATIKAVTAGRMWVLHRNIYRQTAMQNALRDYEETVLFLQNVPLINKLDTENLKKVANLLKKEFFKADTVIVQQGDVGDKFYIIRAGHVSVTKTGEGKVAELNRGAFFGELALLQADCRQATVTANPPGVECLTLTRSEFKEHFDDSIFENKPKVKEPEPPKPPVQPVEAGEYAHINLHELKRVETLGVGGFGRVELVQHKKDSELTFALKYLKKVDTVQQGQVDHVFNEKNIQISCTSTFIVRMYKTFSDNKYLYFLMESCLGGDLWTYLQKQKGRHVSEQAARFFAGCVLEALSYLHDRDYVYRDLKPENLLIDKSGYIKLTDFGFAKHIDRNGRTFTFAGTPEYVAPEIVYNRGHDKAVDYWAFGIFIFELLVGKTPFRSDDPSHMRTYNRILRGVNSVQFPAHVSRNATLIIQKLCKAIPTERLGCQKNGVQDIRNHKWFQSFDWNKLKNRKLKAPFIPKLTSNTDTKYFEKFKIDDDVPPDELSGFHGFES